MIGKSQAFSREGESKGEGESNGFRERGRDEQRKKEKPSVGEIKQGKKKEEVKRVFLFFSFCRPSLSTLCFVRIGGLFPVSFSF